jgi:hypothetical protein
LPDRQNGNISELVVKSIVDATLNSEDYLPKAMKFKIEAKIW